MQLRIKQVFNDDPKAAASFLRNGFHYSDFVNELIMVYQEKRK